MHANQAPMKTKQLAETLYHNFSATAAAQTSEGKDQAKKIAEKAATDFFSTRSISPDKLESLFKKAAHLDPAQLTDPTQRRKFIEFLRDVVPQARAWAPPPCPVVVATVHGPSAIACELARLAPIVSKDSLGMYVGLNRALVNACRQNPSERAVKLEGLLSAAGLPPGEQLECFTMGETSTEGVPLERLFGDPDSESGELLVCLRELKQWLLNCGATQVFITGQLTCEKNERDIETDMPSGLNSVPVTEFTISLLAPPADNLDLLPLQLATQRLTHQIQNLDLGSCTVSW